MALRVLLLLLVFAVGSATTWWFTARDPWRDPARDVELASPADTERVARPHPVAGPTGAEALDLDAVLASLQRIEERLDRLELSADRVVAAPERRSDSIDSIAVPGEQLAAAVARLESLERALTEEVARRRDSAEPNLAELKAEHPEEDWAALDDFMAHWARDEKAAADDLRLLSYRDVLTRFGSPTEMWSNERGTHWTYGQGHDAVDGGYQREVYVRFEDGLVTTLGVK